MEKKSEKKSYYLCLFNADGSLATQSKIGIGDINIEHFLLDTPDNELIHWGKWVRKIVRIAEND